MIAASAALPEAAATACVVCGLVLAAGLRVLPRAARALPVGLAILLMAAGLAIRCTEAGRERMAADFAAALGVIALALHVRLGRQPKGLSRMARAAGAGWISVIIHAALRPLAWRLLACWLLAFVLMACDAGWINLPGRPAAIVPAVCAALASALLLGAWTE